MLGSSIQHSITPVKTIEQHLPFAISRYPRILFSEEPLKSNQRKNGPPSSAVITPTGISAGAISTLASVSQNTRNAPPKKKLAGVKNRWSAPISRRQIWGAIIPTNPIGPQTETTPPIINEVAKNKPAFIFFTSTPRLSAISSPSVSRFNSFVKKKITALPNKVNGRIVKTGRNPTISNPPMSHRIMRNELAKSLKYWMNNIKLEKKKLIATPAINMVAVVNPFLVWEIP